MGKIGFASQAGKKVNVYDETGRFLFSKIGTLQIVSVFFVGVKVGKDIHVYNSKGQLQYSKLIK